MGLTKVFVGNLSFKTKDSDLASEFSSAGKVVSANIITRGPRSLGYGFVELESEEEAQKAVVLMNKKNIDTREINVELARPRDEARLAERRNNPIPRRGIRGRGRGGRGRGNFGRGLGGGGAPAQAPPAAGAAPTGQAPPAAAPASGNGGGAPAASGIPVSGGSPNASPSGGGGGRGNYGRGRRYRPRGEYSGEVGAGGDPSNNNLAGPPPRGRGGRGRGRGSRGRGSYQRPYVPKEPSKTTLYVANLPFSVEDDALSNLFKDLKATKAYVVRAKNNRSKGFGFVEFANEEDQQAAHTAAENFTLGDRQLIVKVAMTENNRPDDAKDSNNETSEAQAPEQEKNENQQNP